VQTVFEVGLLKNPTGRSELHTGAGHRSAVKELRVAGETDGGNQRSNCHESWSVADRERKESQSPFHSPIFIGIEVKMLGTLKFHLT
jgi:hypothetical protein